MKSDTLNWSISRIMRALCSIFARSDEADVSVGPKTSAEIAEGIMAGPDERKQMHTPARLRDRPAWSTRTEGYDRIVGALATMLALAGHMSRAMSERYSHIRLAAKRQATEALSLTPMTASRPAKSDAVPTKVPPRTSTRNVYRESSKCLCRKSNVLVDQSTIEVG
jgi:hypothetical protein